MARARKPPVPAWCLLPADVLERLFAIELETVPALTGPQWRALAWMVRATVVDTSWIEEPGELLAGEVEDADLDPDLEPAAFAKACRSWTRTQALAVIDACQRDNPDSLPVKEQR